MPDTIAITFRDQTHGKIHDFLSDENKQCTYTQSMMGYFSGQLTNYREEGIELNPKILICDDIDSYTSSIPGSIYYNIGTIINDNDTYKKILKDCASLTSDNWHIYVEPPKNHITKYGVFTYPKTPTSLSILETLTLNSNTFCSLLRKTSQNTINITGSKGHSLSLVFSTTRISDDKHDHVKKFTEICCKNVKNNPSYTHSHDPVKFKKYLEKTIDQIINNCHGTILICINHKSSIEKINELKDYIDLKIPIDLYESFYNYENTKSAESILKLQRCEELLNGLVNCDGIVAFDNCGRIVAYRIFFRPPSQEAATTKIVGGARRRAFEGIKPLIGTRKKLRAALFRSQDGETIKY